MDSSAKKQQLILGSWGVRYQVKDVERSIVFYTQTLGFKLEMKNLLMAARRNRADGTA